ncbi:MAG: hypothetical protein ACI9UR_002160 [Bacteroidia bacterium]|jgi:hypothetical protein
MMQGISPETSSISTEDFIVDLYMKEPQMHGFYQISQINFICPKSVSIGESVPENMFFYSILSLSNSSTTQL